MPKYTITLEGDAAADFEAIQQSTHLNGPSDVIRAALNVFNVLLEADNKGMIIFMRDLERRFWMYSPHRRRADENALRRVSAAEVFGENSPASTKIRKVANGDSVEIEG